MKKVFLGLISTASFVTFGASLQGHVHTAACADAVDLHQHTIHIDELKALTVGTSATSDTPVVVDLMAFYQPSYESKMGSQWVHKRIQTLVDNTNAGLKNSGINAEVRLVNAQAITGISDTAHYVDINPSDRIFSPYGADGGYPENIIYTAMGADLALYIRDYNEALQPANALGFGELGGELSTVFDTGTLPSTDPLHPQGEFVLAHEIGHNFNAGHLADDGGYTFLPAAHAFTCAGKTTIMGPADPNGHRFYSSPTKSVNGEACGIAGVADNTSVIAEYAPAAANRRTAPTSKGSVFFTDTNYQYAPGSSSVAISIKRNGDLSESASVQLGLLDGTAKAGVDFTDVTTRLTFEPGQDTAVFSVPVDQTPKGKASIVLRYPHKLTVETSTAQVVFSNETPGTFGFSSSSVTVSESAGSVSLTINRTGGTDGSQSVRVYTADGSRKAGVDFEVYDNVVIFEAGQSSKTVSIKLIDNTIIDADGKFTINMASVDGSNINPDIATLTVTMTNNDTTTNPGGGNGGNNGSGDSGSGGGSFNWFSFLMLGVLTIFRKTIK